MSDQFSIRGTNDYFAFSRINGVGLEEMARATHAVVEEFEQSRNIVADTHQRPGIIFISEFDVQQVLRRQEVIDHVADGGAPSLASGAL